MLKIRYNGVHFLHCFRLISLLPFSTSSSSTPTTVDSFANHLVETLGFSKQQSLSTSAKLSHYRRSQGAKNEVSSSSNFNFVGKCNSVITFLTQIGLNQSNIRYVINCDPRILLSDVPKTLEPKLKILLNLGLPMSDIAPFIAANPFVLRSRLTPVIEVLKQVLGSSSSSSSNENVVRLLRRLRWRTFTAAAKRLVNNVKFLENDYGISSEAFLKHNVYHPTVFSIKPETFRGVLIQVEHKLGVPRHSGMFCYGIRLLVSLSEKTIDSKFAVFKSFGWSHSDVLELVRRNPYCLMISEERVKRSLRFLVNELGYDPAYLATHSALLTCSLERRIVPRYRALQVLKEKGFVKPECSLYSLVRLSEPKFYDKFVKPFKDVVPNLYEVYVTNKKLSDNTANPRKSRFSVTTMRLNSPMLMVDWSHTIEELRL